MDEQSTQQPAQPQSPVTPPPTQTESPQQSAPAVTPPAASTSSSTNHPELPGAWDLLNPSIDVLKRCFLPILTLAAAPVVVTILAYALIFANVRGNAPASFGLVGVVLLIVALAGAALVTPAAYIASLQAARGHKPNAGEVFRAGRPLVWRFVGLSIVLGFIYILSILALIVPFFFMMKRYFLAPYYLIDRNLSIGDALKRSAEAAKRPKAIWGVLGVTWLFSAPSFIPYIGRPISLALGLLYDNAPTVRYLQILALEEGDGAAKGHNDTPVAQNHIAQQFTNPV